jgi:GTPase SAR1 family protein
MASMREIWDTADGADSSFGLRSYERAKHGVAEFVQSIKQYAESHRDSRAASECRELLVRLAEDRFNLVVVGQFSRGKTSLMNAVMGTARLPTGVLPLTSVITAVAYGEREEAFIRRNGWSLPQRIEIADLPRFITEEGNPGNEKRVNLAEVRLPAEFLRLGAYFIDTPGVGSAVAANTQTTSSFLPESDAVVFVTACDSLLSEAELRFLSQVRLHVRKIFVVVNKRDLVTRDQEDEIRRFARERLEQVFAGQTGPPLFFISARTALRAKLDGDAGALAASGLPEFEQHLTQFLQRDKTREFLRRIVDRARWIVGTLTAESRAAGSVPKAAENLAAFDDQLAVRLHEAHRAERELFERLRRHLRLELPRLFEHQLGELYVELSSGLEAAARRSFREARPRSLRGLGPRLLAEAAECGSRTASSFLAEHEAPFRAFVESAVDAESSPLVRALVSLETLSHGTEDCAGDATEAARRKIAEFARSTPLLFRSLSTDLWRFAIPWWVAALPAGPIRRKAEQRLVNQLHKSVAAHREELIRVLIEAVDHWIDILTRHFEEWMNGVVEHQRDVIRRTPSSNDAGDLERIAALLNRLANELNDEPGCKQPRRHFHAGPPRSDIAARCLVCAHLETEVFEYLRRKQYELSVSDPVRSLHADNGGFCAIHTWQYEAIASPQGVSTAYPVVLFRLSAELAALAAGQDSASVLRKAVRRLSPDAAECELCRLIATVESTGSESVLAAMRTRARRLPPLCLRHLQSVLARTPDAETARLLVDEQARVFQRLSEEMQSYSTKHDALRRQLATSREHAAYRLALEKLAGSRSLALPYRDERYFED